MHFDPNYHETFLLYPAVFRSVIAIGAGLDLDQAYVRLADWSGPIGSYEYQMLIAALRDPGLFGDEAPSAAAMYMAALQQAQARFAARDCHVPTREDILSGLFRGALADSLLHVNDQVESTTYKTGRSSRIYAFVLDLTLRGRETRTGGDFALLLDTSPHPHQSRFLPICLQAKRTRAVAPARAVDLRRATPKLKNADQEQVAPSDGTHQLDALKETRKLFPAAYLIYDNSDEVNFQQPVLPIVKDINHLDKHESATLKACLDTSVVDLAFYVRHLLADDQEHVNGEDELLRVLEHLSRGQVDHLVTLTTNADFPLRYAILRDKLVAKGVQWPDGDLLDLQSVRLRPNGPPDVKKAFETENAFAEAFAARTPCP
ncbi:hypothetical protein [Methylobacterium indicum]|uniref:hypothetical protein n=1 Tax=Methylobacterium indicum TaxID=1775910 RepID=UPI000B154791|nr:hypothetical protein [Methylobacterium indicum]